MYGNYDIREVFCKIIHFYRGNGSDARDSFLKTTESEFVHQLNRDFWQAWFYNLPGPATPPATCTAQVIANEVGRALFARRNDSARSTEFLKRRKNCAFFVPALTR